MGALFSRLEGYVENQDDCPDRESHHDAEGVQSDAATRMKWSRRSRLIFCPPSASNVVGEDEMTAGATGVG